MPEESTPQANRKIGGGPLGYGDPEDKFLRKVEIEVLIPQKMRDKARAEKCNEEVKKFTECCASSKLAMVYKCRTENNLLKACLTRWYEDEEFKKLCRAEYLEERSEFRRKGNKKDIRRVGASM